MKITFWFKARVEVSGSRWDANLSPRRDTLRDYEKQFLDYF